MSVYRACVKDGSYRDLEVEVVNRLEEPAVRGLVANFRDVTQRRRAEAEREHSLSLLEATLESTADGIMVADLQGRVKRFNQKFSAMWLVPRELLASGEERALAASSSSSGSAILLIDGVRALYWPGRALDTCTFATAASRDYSSGGCRRRVVSRV
jgi:hypothetical protein